MVIIKVQIKSEKNAELLALTECATRIAGQLSGSGDSAAFKEFAWRFVAIISKALFDIGTRPTYDLIRRYITDMEPLFIEYCEAWLTRQKN